MTDTPIKLDPEATYTHSSLAAVLGINTATLWRWRKSRRMGFPRPFRQGRCPCWRGRVVIDWQDRRQQEVMG